MKEVVRKVYAEARAAHERCYRQIMDAQRALVAEGDLRELGDAVFALKKSEDLLEDARKECGKLKSLVEKITCVRWLNQGDHDPIRTEYCTASPDIKQTVSVPSKDSPEYKALLTHFGIPEGAPFAPHWPSLMKQVSANLAAGQPIPAGCDPNKMIEVCVVRTLKKGRPILDEGEALPYESPEVLRDAAELLFQLDQLDFNPIMRQLAVASDPAAMTIVARLGVLSGLTRNLEARDTDKLDDENAEVQSEIDADAGRKQAAVSNLPAAPDFMREERQQEEGVPF